MATWLVTVGLVSVLLGQAEPGDKAATANEVVEKAIQELGDSRFAVRQQASRVLWEQGLPAESALKAAAESADRETRLRARSILNDFRYGILPGVPADTMALIRQFRDGNADERMLSLQRLADRSEFETLQRLFQLEDKIDVRRRLLVHLMQNPRAVDKFLDVERLEKLIASVGADQDDVWRRTVLVQLLFTDKMVQQLAEKDRLSVLVKIVEKETSAEVRRQMLNTLLQNQTAVTSLLDKDLLGLMLQLIGREPEKTLRGTWIGQLLLLPEVAKRLAQDQRLDRVLKSIQDNVDAAQRAEVYQRLFQSPPLVEALLTQGGIARLVALATAERDPGARGRLQAALAMSGPIRQQLNEAGQRDLALKLAREEQDPTARGEYLKTLLESGAGYFLFRDHASRKSLWELVKADVGAAKTKSPSWRGEAVLQILSLSSVDELFRDVGELKWLFKFLREAASPQQQSRILERVVSDYRLQQLLFQHAQFDALLNLLRELPASTRGRLLGQLFRSAEVAQRLVNAKQTALFLTLAEQESDAEARSAYLQGLFSNPAAMTALLQGGSYEALWAYVTREQDPVRHAAMRGEFLRTQPVIQLLASKGLLDGFVKFAQDQEPPEARRQFLQRLFSNELALAALIDKGHYEALYALARGDADEASRATLLAGFYTSPKVIEQLIAKKQLAVLFEFAETCSDTNQLLPFLQRLCNNQQVMAALVEQGRLDALLTLARKPADKYQRASLLGMILAAPSVVKRFAQDDQWKTFLKLLEDEPPDTRLHLYYPLLGRPDTVAMLIEKGRLDDMLTLLKKEPRPEIRGQWLAMFLVQPKTLERLAAEKRLNLILATAREQHDENGRRQFLQTLFNNGAAVGTLLDQGQFDALYELASNEADPQQRAQHLGQLLTNPKAIIRLVEKKNLGLLVTLAEEQVEEQVRRDFLAHLFASSQAVAALIDQGQFEPLLKLCRSEPDASTRRRLLAEFLLSGKAVEQLARAGSLAQTVQDVLQEPEREIKQQFLERWFGRAEAIGVLVEKGLFDTLYKAAEAEPDSVRVRQLLGQLLTNQQTLQYLATGGKLDLLMHVIAEETEPWRRTYYLQNLVAKPEAVKMLLAGNRFEELLKLIQREPQTPVRSSLLTSLLLSPATLEHLTKTNQLPRLAEAFQQTGDPQVGRQLVSRLLNEDAGRQALGTGKLGELLIATLKADPDAATRQNYARQALQDQRVRQTLIDSGQVQILYELAKWEPDEQARRTSLQRMLYAPSGLVPYHLQRGDLAQARQLLEDQATDDLGRLRLATYLLLTGDLERRIAEVRKQSSETTQARDARLLTYLLRAQGDLTGAREAAAATQDPGLLKSLLVEQRQWAEAASLQAAGPCPLPIPWQVRSSAVATHQRVEQLGLVAAYQRLAGAEPECDKALAEIQQLATTQAGDQALRWFSVEALLLNDRVEPGLKLLAETDPARAFDFYTQRYQYSAALELAHWREGVVLDRAWLDGLLPVESKPQPVLAPAGQAPEEKARDDNKAREGEVPAEPSNARLNPAAARRRLRPGNTTSAPNILPRFDFALKVARTLHVLGKRDAAQHLLELLDAYAQEQPDDNQSSLSPRRQCWERLCVALVRNESEPQAWEVAARTISHPNSTPNVLFRLYGRRQQEAWGWWTVFRSRFESEPSAATFARVHKVLNPVAENAQDFAQLAETATQLALTISDSRRGWMLFSVGEAALRRGQLELARRSLEAARDTNPAAASLLAEVLRRSEKWPETAAACEALWKADHEQLAALYLSGDALERAGRADEGRQRKELASRMALDSRARFELAVNLLQHELREDAERQFRLVLRTAPLEHLEWQEAARYLGERFSEGKPGEAAEWLEYPRLDDLRTYFYMLNDADYLVSSAIIHRLRATAAIQAGQFDVASREIQLTLAALPGDTLLAEELTPALDKVNRQPPADELFGQLRQVFSEQLQAFPQSALLHNNLAWLSARCGRRLDEALQHAEQAVQLAPQNAGYLDTLAEVYFRRGDRDTAVRHERHALELSPDHASFKTQLDRFEHAPLPPK